MTEAHQHWERLAAAVRDRRQDLGMTQQDLAARSQTSPSTVYALETVSRMTFADSTLRKISRALEWTPDSAGEILAGADPQPELEVAEDQQTLRDILIEITGQLARIEAALTGEPPSPTLPAPGYILSPEERERLEAEGADASARLEARHGVKGDG